MKILTTLCLMFLFLGCAHNPMDPHLEDHAAAPPISCDESCWTSESEGTESVAIENVDQLIEYLETRDIDFNRRDPYRFPVYTVHPHGYYDLSGNRMLIHLSIPLSSGTAISSVDVEDSKPCHTLITIYESFIGSGEGTSQHMNGFYRLNEDSQYLILEKPEGGTTKTVYLQKVSPQNQLRPFGFVSDHMLNRMLNL